MRRKIAAGVVVCVIVGVSAALATRHARPRNVILICIDTVRYDTFWMPDERGIGDRFTPWAKRSSQFRNVQSTSSWTVPAVVSVLTGLYPVQHGAGSFEDPIANFEPMTPSALAADVVTVPTILSNAGFQTAAFVANPFISASTGAAQGIAELHAVETGDIPKLAGQWIDQRHADQKPFFLYLHFMDAHGDHWNARPDLERRVARLPDAIKRAAMSMAPAGDCRDQQSEWCARYLAYAESVFRLRTELAGMLDALQANGTLDNTLVVLFSDHGEEFLDHERVERDLGQDPRGFYGVGHGHSMFQELLHVPVLVWAPLNVPIQVAAPVSLVDLAPTILERLGLESALPRFAGRPLPNTTVWAQPPNRRPLFSSGIAYGPRQFAVQSEGWKEIEISCPPRRLLFRMPADGSDSLEASDAAIESRLTALLAEYKTMTPAGGAVSSSISREQMEQFQSLGYLQPGRSTAGCASSPTQ